MDIDDIKKSHKKRIKKETNDEKKSFNYLKCLISRTLIAIIFLLMGIIFYKIDTSNKELINKYLYEDNWNFINVKNIFEDKIGKIIPVSKINSELVMSNGDFTTNPYDYKNDLTIFSLKEDINITALCGGIVVFMGNKDNLGNTIIIQGNDGIDIWYSNITNSNISLYDYVDKNTIIGESVNKSITLKISKNGNFISYEEYIK